MIQKRKTDVCHTDFRSRFFASSSLLSSSLLFSSSLFPFLFSFWWWSLKHVYSDEDAWQVTRHVFSTTNRTLKVSWLVSSVGPNSSHMWVTWQDTCRWRTQVMLQIIYDAQGTRGYSSLICSTSQNICHCSYLSFGATVDRSTPFNLLSGCLLKWFQVIMRILWKEMPME